MNRSDIRIDMKNYRELFLTNSKAQTVLDVAFTIFLSYEVFKMMIESGVRKDVVTLLLGIIVTVTVSRFLEKKEDEPDSEDRR